jgi:enoyl-CoA hydratase
VHELENVTYRLDGNVGVITWAKQPLNTYDGRTHWEIEECWNIAAADKEAKVILFMARGKHFCAGADLSGNGEARPDDVPPYHPWAELEFVRKLPKPTIAAVQGGCVGGGQRLVFPCDLIFCTEDAFFRDPTASMGIGGIQGHVHTWFYGPRLAKEMLFFGSRLPARRLYEMGMVNRLYGTVEELHTEALAAAHQLAEADQLALRQAKRAVNTTTDIQGMHYIANRFDELMDDFPRMNLRLPGR